MRLAAAGLALLAALGSHAAAQTPETAGEFWPAADIHAQLGSNLRLLGFAGLKRARTFLINRGISEPGSDTSGSASRGRISKTSTRTRKAS